MSLLISQEKPITRDKIFPPFITFTLSQIRCSSLRVKNNTNSTSKYIRANHLISPTNTTPFIFIHNGRVLIPLSNETERIKTFPRSNCTRFPEGRGKPLKIPSALVKIGRGARTRADHTSGAQVTKLFARFRINLNRNPAAGGIFNHGSIYSRLSQSLHRPPPSSSASSSSSSVPFKPGSLLFEPRFRGLTDRKTRFLPSYGGGGGERETLLHGL